MLKFLQILIILSAVLCSACQPSKSLNTIKVGTIAGPETELMEAAKKVAKNTFGLNVEIVQFTDYTMPNAALNDGSIDANMFQTIPYFNADRKARHFDLAIVGKTFIYPMAIYSLKIKNIKSIPQNATVAIPNDPSNEARALLLLVSAGLITLKHDSQNLPSVYDISNNPKNLIIKTLDAAQLPRILPDVDLAVINTNYAIPAGLYPKENALFVESKNSPYANILVVRSSEQGKLPFKQLLESLHSKVVLEKAKELFKDQAIPAW